MTVNAPPPVIVLAAGRSFSSVFAGMLGQHPELYGLPELQLFSAPTVGGVSVQNGGNYPHGLLRTLAEHEFGGQTELNVNRTKKWLRGWQDRPSIDLFNYILEMVAPRRLVDKSILTTWRESNIQRVIDACPDASFIHLTRHPLTQGTSRIAFFESIATLDQQAVIKPPWLYDFATEPPTLDPQLHWLQVNQNIVNSLQQVPASQQKTLAGEDLLPNPPKLLKELCQWMGLRDDDEAIEAMMHPEDSIFAGHGPVNARYGSDPKYLESPALRAVKFSPTDMSEPPPWRPDGEFFPEVQNMARRFGYQ